MPLFFRCQIAFSLLVLCLLQQGCQSLQVNNLRDRMQPSNSRDWTAELTVLPYAEVSGDQVTVRNIRDCEYVTANDFVLEHYDRTFAIDDIRSVDFVVVPFGRTTLLAHTILSFGLSDESRIAVSVEIRTEKQEDYSALLGTTNQFELIYVVASEADVIRLRAKHRESDVYVYPTVADARQSQELFLSVMQRVNKLAGQPEFYNTLNNNCTTNIYEHVKQLQGQQSAANTLKYSWQILLPGYSDRYAYDHGLLKTNLSFKETKALAKVNDLAEIHFDDPDFSRKIRARHSAFLSNRFAQGDRQ